MAARAACASSGYLPSRRRLRGCTTGQPRATASCLTGEACSFMPRPAGRSGCVITRAISKDAAAIASSATRANSGVPANAILMRPSQRRQQFEHQVVTGVVALHHAVRIDVDVKQARCVLPLVAPGPDIAVEGAHLGD